MKKAKDMNEREKKAYRNMHYAMLDFTGLWENGLLDSPKGTEEYEEAYKNLHDLEILKESIYDYGTNNYYLPDRFGGYATMYNEKAIRDIRFCGKEFLMDCIDDILDKEYNPMEKD